MQTIGIAVAFDDVIVTQGLRTALLIAAYKKADLCIGQFSKAMQLSHDEAMRLLSMMGVDVIDYDFDDDLQLFEYQP